MLPVKPWEDRFKERYPRSEIEHAEGTPAQLALMKEELAAWRELFSVGPIDFTNLAGSMTSRQRTDLLALAFNMLPFGREGTESLIRAATVIGYINGARDMKDEQKQEHQSPNTAPKDYRNPILIYNQRVKLLDGREGVVADRATHRKSRTLQLDGEVDLKIHKLKEIGAFYDTTVGWVECKWD